MFSRTCVMSIAGTDDFPELIFRVCAGDQAAAAELVRRYEPLIRREVRLKLENGRLRRVLDSMDVCQSVLASFFIRAAAGQYDLDQPGQLIHLLVTIARNKVASAARREFSQRRDGRRLDAGGHALGALAAGEPGPSTVVASAELLSAFRERLTGDERRLVDLRADGDSWAEIATKLGGTADARRVQLSRAIERITRELQIDEGISDND